MSFIVLDSEGAGAVQALAATITGTTTVTADMAVAKRFAATSAGATTVTGTLIRAVSLAANSAGTTSVTASLVVHSTFTATSNGVCTVTASLTRAVSLASVAAGGTTVSASLSVVHPFAGTAVSTKLRILEDALRTFLIEATPARTARVGAERFARAYQRYATFLRANDIAPTLTGSEFRRMTQVLSQGFSVRSGGSTHFAETIDGGLKAFWSGVHFGTGTFTRLGTAARKGLAVLPNNQRSELVVRRLAKTIHEATMGSIVTFPMPGGPVPLV